MDGERDKAQSHGEDEDRGEETSRPGGVTSWTVVNMSTGEKTDLRIDPEHKPTGHSVPHGYEPPRTLMDVYRILTHGLAIDRTDRMRYGGETDDFRRRLRLRGAGGRARSAEDSSADGWAASWLAIVQRDLHGAPTGLNVAAQLARLVGDGREVTIADRSLADAVGRRDRAGRMRAYTQSGVQVLIRHGFIEKDVTGRGRGAKTTYRLLRPLGE